MNKQWNASFWPTEPMGQGPHALMNRAMSSMWQDAETDIIYYEGALYNVMANVKDYSAPDDGVDDAADAFNKAISYVNDAGGGIVWVPEGTYRLASTLDMYEKVYIIGVSADAVNLVADAGLANAINYDASTDFLRWGGLKNLTITGQSEASSIGVKVDAVRFMRIQDCRFVNWAIGIELIDTQTILIQGCRFELCTEDSILAGENDDSDGCRNIKIDKCHFANESGDSIHLVDSSYSTISECWMRVWLAQSKAADAHVHLSGTGSGTKIINNQISDTDTGNKILVEGTQTFVDISGNTIFSLGAEQTTADAIDIGASCTYANIRNNIIKNHLGGKGITGASDYSVVQGNQIYNNVLTGIEWTGDYVQINGNYIDTITDVNHGIYVTGDYADIKQNTVVRVRGYDGIYLNGTAHGAVIGNTVSLNDRRGINLEDCAKVNVTGNTVVSNSYTVTDTYPAILLQGTTSRCLLTSNYIESISAARRHTVPILEQDTANHNEIASNTFYNNQSDLPTLIGANTILRHNNGAADSEAITATVAGVAASLFYEATQITSDGNGGANADNVTLADGKYNGQKKVFTYVAEGNAGDTVIITPANFNGGTEITFDTPGEGCTMEFDGTNWNVVGNNGGAIT